MNDRYLYRAKRTDNGEWVGGNLIWNKDFCDNSKAIIIPTTRNNLFTRGGENGHLVSKNWCRVDQSTICQCTGLKDKNGKLIWENDIVRICDYIVKVLWCDEFALYRLDTKNFKFSYFFGETFKAEDVEIIGNIFDNSELLEVGE